MDHHEFIESGMISNPLRATNEKGEEAFRRLSEIELCSRKFQLLVMSGDWLEQDHANLLFFDTDNYPFEGAGNSCTLSPSCRICSADS
jgi:hypothetical protein